VEAIFGAKCEEATSSGSDSGGSGEEDGKVHVATVSKMKMIFISIESGFLSVAQG
jgi:hypothetical protein